MREDYWSEEYEQDSNFQQHKEVNKKMKGRNNTPNTFKAKTDSNRDTTPLRPMNDRQAEYIDAIYNHAVVIATGVWGSSKAQPLYSKVLTPNGWTTMGELGVGDFVTTPKNTPAKILEVHPFSQKNVYEFTFKDGRVVRSCEDHLWNVRVRNSLSAKVISKNDIDTVTTRFIVDNIDNLTFSVPLCEEIGSTEDIDLPIDPYLMGLLLAEGHLGNRISISTADSFIVEYLEEAAKSLGCYLKKAGSYDYFFNMEGFIPGNQTTGTTNPIKKKIEELGLLDTRSNSKFIPEIYLKASIAQKWELIQGLMDGDGTVSPAPSLVTTSEVMANQFVDLARSLGCYSSIHKKPSTFTYKGEKKSGLDVYNVTIINKCPKKIFKLPRKKDQMLEQYQGGRYELMNKISKVEYVGKEDVQCILIDDSDHLYLTDGFTVTHNTYIPSVIACDMLLAKKIDKIVVARPAEGKAKSVGFYKGTKDEKLSGWVAPIADVFKKRLGIGHYEAYVENGKIELLSLEQVKGRSWDNTFIIVDEAEDLAPEVAKSLVGRQGVNSITVVTGDIDQKDLKSYSGLELLLEVSKYGNIDMSIVDFDKWEYCVRSQEAKAWGMAFEKYERRNGRVK